MANAANARALQGPGPAFGLNEGDKIYESIHENAPNSQTAASGVTNSATASSASETPTLWMWVLTFVSGISGVCNDIMPQPVSTARSC